MLFSSLVVALVFGIGARAAARSRVDAVADLVALAAAHDQQTLATQVAAANGVRLDAAFRRGESVVVEVVSDTMRGRSSAHLTMGAVGCSSGLLHCRGGTRR